MQSSPHIQASTSLLSGEMSTGLSSPLLEANKLLRFCKTNSDVHLRFPPLGKLEDLRLSCMFDAALGVRHDASSQGGYIVLLTHKDTFNGTESPYHVLDWRSFRLPRVARSSLAAEVQSAAQALDSTEFVVRFWYMTMHPNASLKETLNVRDPTLAPIFVTDAKALYDSYHRDAINHGATDKRTNLELRVLYENKLRALVGSWNGSLLRDNLAMVLQRWLQGNFLQIEFDMVPSSTPGTQHTRRQRRRLHKSELKAGMNLPHNFHVTNTITFHSTTLPTTTQ